MAAQVRLLLLAALAGEHILYLGPPGTAKSELGRRLAQLYDGPFFERLLTRFSVPEELFGPLSMRALEDDRYVRQVRLSHRPPLVSLSALLDSSGTRLAAVRALVHANNCG